MSKQLKKQIDRNSKNPAPARRPGRPASKQRGEEVRAALLQAAREYFTRRDFKAVSLRQIAASVGVNPAMVHYYFGSKEGLYLAMLEESVAPLIEQLQAIQADAGKAGRAALSGFLRDYMTTILREPWLPNLIVRREILYQEGELREQFINLFAFKLEELLVKLLERGKQEGKVPGHIKPELGALSIVSMALFPFIARPVAEKVFQLQVDEDFVAQMAEHISALFYPTMTGNNEA